MKTKTNREGGLSLVEVLLVVATVVLLGSLLLPAMPRCKARPARIQCTSNLKRLGLACRLWSNDHDDKFPFASTNADSSIQFVNSREVFRHYAVLSNELITPKVLVCPTDSTRQKASDFTAFSNANVSYFAGVDADQSDPQQLLSGDRNITGGTLEMGFMRVLTPQSNADWNSEMHQNVGNLGLADGSALQVSAPTLRRELQAQKLPVIHLAIP